MKKVLFIIVLALFVNKADARAKIPVCIPCEKITKIEGIKESVLLNDSFGNKFHLAYMYDEYGIIAIPAWISNGKYVLTNDKEDTYWEISPEESALYANEFKIDMSKNPLSFWKKFGGKLVYILIIGFLVLSKLRK